MTHVVGITPPAGWRLAYMTTPQVVVELGELVPEGQAVEQWRDLISYSTAPAAAPTDMTNPQMTIDTIGPNCEAFASVQAVPAGADPAERWLEFACLLRPGAPNTQADAPLEIYVYRMLRSGDAQFQFWRAWRGTTAELGAMLARAGVSAAVDLPARPSPQQLLALEPALRALVGPWGRELLAAFEVCDLAGAPCASLNRPLDRAPPQGADNMAAAVSIRGDNTNPRAVQVWFLRQFMPQLQHMRPEEVRELLRSVMVDQGVQPRTHDFRSMRRTAEFGANMVLANQGIGGMSLVGDDVSPSPPSQAARLRAYLLKVARMMASGPPDGLAPDALTFDLWLDR
jgi:hypothetical protein